MHMKFQENSVNNFLLRKERGRKYDNVNGSSIRNFDFYDCYDYVR